MGSKSKTCPLVCDKPPRYGPMQRSVTRRKLKGLDPPARGTLSTPASPPQALGEEVTGAAHNCGGQARLTSGDGHSAIASPQKCATPAGLSYTLLRPRWPY